MKKGIFLCLSNEAAAVCPVCGSTLKPRDFRVRVRKRHGGIREYIEIRRLKCPVCGRLHNELPDILTPFKHYGSEVIEDVVDGIVSPEELLTEDYPCEKTMERWNQWIQSNTLEIERYLQRSQGPDTLLLNNVRSRGAGWMGVVAQAVYNAGGRM